MKSASKYLHPSSADVLFIDLKIADETLRFLYFKESLLTFQDNQCAISTHLCSQTMTDVVGNPEEERRAEFYYQPWAQEAVCRYFYSKVCPFSFPYHSFSSSCEVMQAAQFIHRSFASLKKTL